MNKSLKIILLGVAISSLPFAGYAQDKPNAPAPSPTSELKNTREPVAGSASNSGPPSPHIFYLTQRLSLTTSTGIIGFNPGTGVQVLKDNGQTLHVLAEGTEMDIPRNVLTDDFGYAQTIATNDYNARLQTAQEVSHQQEVAQQMKAQEDKQINLQPQKQNQAAVGSWSSSSANPLNQRPHKVGRRNVSDGIAAMKADKKRLSRLGYSGNESSFPITSQQQKENNIRLEHERDAIGRQMLREGISRDEYNRLRPQFENIENTLREHKRQNQPGVGSFDSLTPGYSGDR